MTFNYGAEKRKFEKAWSKLAKSYAEAGMESEAIKQDFDLVQRIRGLDTRTSPKQDTVYLFSGVLICGCCGSRMTRKTNRVNGNIQILEV